ncbi:AAA family ATPase [bacterium]|nr:AAA family ATPase [bacterium]
MAAKMRYSVHRIRLINFHNFTNETIQIGNGGHLFLLGDNGSGKTTLLDALHMVLVGNEAVEFNAAARVAGSARDGRRVVGIILGQNAERAEPLRKQGGITYAAVELLGSNGKPLCLTLGMRAHSMDENVRYWGAVKACSLEDLPLMKDTLERPVPLNRREFRAELQDDNAFCGDQTTYRKKLSARLFGARDDDNSLFRETCRLLRMGKAYREIAAGTSNYHALFKKLLIEPKRELFEQVIQRLNELETSTSELAGMEEKHRYLEALEGLVEKIQQHREADLRYTWLSHHLTINQLNGHLETNERKQNQAQELIEKAARSIETSRAERDRTLTALNDLREQDREGLLGRRAERERDRDRLGGEIKRQRENVKQYETELGGLQRDAKTAEDSWRKTLQHAYDELNRLNKRLPFAVVDLLSQLDEQLRLPSPVDAIVPDTEACESDAASANREAVELKVELGGKLDQLQSEADELRSELNELQAGQELLPPVAGYRNALRALSKAMIQVTPLYQGLEWKPGLSESAQQSIEEAIGADVLSTLLVSAEDYDSALRAVLPDGPGIRVAMPDVPDEAVPAWVMDSFDLDVSDPRAVRVLIEEMRAGNHPSVRQQDAFPVLRFRAHERRLRQDAQGLIGSAQRKRAMQQRIRELESQLKELDKEQRGLEKQQKAVDERLAAIQQVQISLRKWTRELQDRIHLAQSSMRDAEAAGRRVAGLQDDLRQMEARHAEIVQQLADLQARISERGLDRLKQKQQRLENRLKRFETDLDELNQEIGGLNSTLADLRERAKGIERQRTEEQKALAAASVELEPLAEAVESVAYWVLKTNRGGQFVSVENVEAERRRNDAAMNTAVGELNTRLHSASFGAVYAFTYDTAHNLLLDRHQSSIADVVKVSRREIDEQRTLINERTQRLIRELIMGELFVELKGSVQKLQELVRKINAQLGGRVFGSTRYRFNLKEVPHYRDLLHAIQRLSPLDPSAQQELEQFLELHKDEILHTEVNDVPEALDYRNWFQYELVVQTTDDQGEIVMDRRTKSLGSGGEQAVPNYLLILTVAHLLYEGNDALRLRVLIFDEAFYGIDSGRRDQLLGFASDLGLQLFIASPELDGVKQEIPFSTTLLVTKDDNCDVHLFRAEFRNEKQASLLESPADAVTFEPVGGNGNA